MTCDTDGPSLGTHAAPPSPRKRSNASACDVAWPAAISAAATAGRPIASRASREARRRANIDRHADPLQARANFLHARRSLLALAREERGEIGVGRVDEVAEHVHVPTVLDGRDFDAVDEA